MSFTKKHTLDSDEEDDVVEEKQLQDSDIEGQEDTAVDIEEGIRFTPFHMRDELAEGHFDAEGMYIFNKNKDEIADKWIEDVNWSEVRNTEALLKRKREKEEERIALEMSEETLNVDNTMEKMLLLMSPGETVLSAIKRLGKNKATNLPVWKKKKLEKTNKTQPDSNGNIDGEKLSELIGYADKLLLDGMTSIYSDTFEKISYQLVQKQTGVGKQAFDHDRSKIHGNGKISFERSDELKSVNNLTEVSATAIDDVDIFGDASITSDKPVESTRTKKKDAADLVHATESVSWEFKWENMADSELHGPYSTEQMQQWVDEEYFKDGVFVRKCNNADSNFYTSRRIDFSLYL